MDITFKTEQGRFNYRVCAVMLHNEKILAMRDERSPYYYLPGGRVNLHETAQEAVVREVREELGVSAEIARPLWLNQSFFTEDVSGEKYHELCLYFLMDITKTDLLKRGNPFQGVEKCHQHLFEWIAFDRLKDEYLYPIFIKREIYHLPEHFELRIERE